MTVVQINCSSNGSTGNIAKAIHRSLLDNGNSSYIFFGGGTPTEKNMFRIGNDFSLHLHSVLSRNLGKQGYFSLFATKKLIQQLKKIQPDIIHLHNLHGSYLNLPLLFRYLKNSSANIVLTLHDCWLFTGKCPHFTVVGCDKWKESCGNCPQLSTYPRSKVDTTSKSLSDKKKWLSGFGNRMHIVAVSDWLCNTAMQSYLSQYYIKRIYNGIDVTVFKPTDTTLVRQKYGLENKYIILGVSSNWNKQKGLKEFLQLSENLKEDEVIVLVGMTEKQIEELPDNMIGIARTESQAELAALYSAADVFVNTSKEETFGLVTAEAMACGTPVIVYDSTACAEIVDQHNGYVMSTDEGEQLHAYIQRAKVDALHVNTIYSDKIMVEQYIKLYEEVCDVNEN